MKKIIKMILKQKKKKTNVNITESISNIRNLLSELTSSLDELNGLLKKFV